MFRQLRVIAQIALLFLVSISQMAVSSPTVKDSGKKVAIIKQEGSVAGRESIYVGSDAIRIDNPERNIVTIAKAPQWDVTTYNPARKMYFVAKVNKYHGQMTHLFLFYGIDMANYDFIPDHKITFLNRPASVMKAVVSKKDFEEKSITDALKLFVVADDSTLPKAAMDVLSRHLSLPLTHKLPLRMDYLTESHSKHAIDTASWTTGIVVNTWFDLPGGYTLCAKESDVYFEDKF